MPYTEVELGRKYTFMDGERNKGQIPRRKYHCGSRIVLQIDESLLQRKLNKKKVKITQRTVMKEKEKDKERDRSMTRPKSTRNDRRTVANENIRTNGPAKTRVYHYTRTSEDHYTRFRVSGPIFPRFFLS